MREDKFGSKFGERRDDIFKSLAKEKLMRKLTFELELSTRLVKT